MKAMFLRLLENASHLVGCCREMEDEKARASELKPFSRVERGCCSVTQNSCEAEHAASSNNAGRCPEAPR